MQVDESKTNRVREVLKLFSLDRRYRQRISIIVASFEGLNWKLTYLALLFFLSISSHPADTFSAVFLVIAMDVPPAFSEPNACAKIAQAFQRLPMEPGIRIWLGDDWTNSTFSHIPIDEKNSIFGCHRNVVVELVAGLSIIRLLSYHNNNIHQSQHRCNDDNIKRNKGIRIITVLVPHTFDCTLRKCWKFIESSNSSDGDIRGIESSSQGHFPRRREVLGNTITKCIVLPMEHPTKNLAICFRQTTTTTAATTRISRVTTANRAQTNKSTTSVTKLKNDRYDFLQRMLEYFCRYYVNWTSFEYRLLRANDKMGHKIVNRGLQATSQLRHP